MEIYKRIKECKAKKTEITSLENCFGFHVTDEKKIANLLNFRFSKLGDKMGTARPYNPPTVHETKITKKYFRFNPSVFMTAKNSYYVLIKINLKDRVVILHGF